MTRTISRSILVLIFASFIVSSLSPFAVSIASPAATKFSDKELDELFAPIALYADPLLAQVIPAATFVDQVVQANKTLKGSVNEKTIEKQNWDVSVKSVAHYPSVLKMMAEQKDWTTAIGQAYVYQSTDVMKSIQRLRALAKGNGSLVTTSEQTVTESNGYITIVPAQPKYIYVPVYDPQVVYVSTGPSPGAVALAFGAGLAIGAWLNRDWHWYGPGIYYHGWVGVGWIGVNRTFIHVNHYYVNRSFTHVSVNRTIVNRNITTFRGDLNNRVVTGHHYDINRGSVSRDINRGNVNRTNINRTSVNRSSVNRRTTTHTNTAARRTGTNTTFNRSNINRSSINNSSARQTQNRRVSSGHVRRSSTGPGNTGPRKR